MECDFESNGITLYRGDCTEILPKLGQEMVDIIIASPPYWNQKEYCFWQKYSDYLESVTQWIGACFSILKKGRHCFWVIPDKLPWPPKENGTNERLYWPIYSDTERIAAQHGFICEFPIVWKKPHGAQKMFGSYPYPPTVIHTPMTERICVWRKPGHPDLSNKSPEDKFTKEEWVTWAQDLWQIDPETTIKNHPAPFPVELPTRICRLWSFKNDTVLDPFMGSGTTGISCVLTGHKFVGIEINSRYFAMSVNRIKATIRRQSIHQVQMCL